MNQPVTEELKISFFLVKTIIASLIIKKINNKILSDKKYHEKKI